MRFSGTESSAEMSSAEIESPLTLSRKIIVIWSCFARAKTDLFLICLLVLCFRSIFWAASTRGNGPKLRRITCLLSGHRSKQLGLLFYAYDACSPLVPLGTICGVESGI